MGTGRGAETPGLAPGGVHGHSPPPPVLLLCAPTHGQLHAASHDRAERGSSAGSTELCSPPQPLGKVEGSDPTPCRAAWRRAKRAQKNPTGGAAATGECPEGPHGSPPPRGRCP